MDRLPRASRRTMPAISNSVSVGCASLFLFPYIGSANGILRGDQLQLEWRRGFPEARLADGYLFVSYTGVDLKTPSEGRENMQLWSKDLLSTPHLKIEKLALNSPYPQDSPGTGSQGKQLVVCAPCGRERCPITFVAAEYCGSE